MDLGLEVAHRVPRHRGVERNRDLAALVEGEEVGADDADDLVLVPAEESLRRLGSTG